MSSFSDTWWGTPGQVKSVSTQTPEQNQFFSQYLNALQGPTGSGMDYLMNILSGDPSAFQAFEAPYKRQFQEEVMPAIGERFGGSGSHGNWGSSALNQSLSKAGRTLTENLASLRGGLQQQALGQLQGFMNPAFGQRQENIYETPTQGLFAELLKSLASAAGKKWTGGV